MRFTSSRYIFALLVCSLRLSLCLAGEPGELGSTSLPAPPADTNIQTSIDGVRGPRSRYREPHRPGGKRQNLRKYNREYYSSRKKALETIPALESLVKEQRREKMHRYVNTQREKDPDAWKARLRLYNRRWVEKCKRLGKCHHGNRSETCCEARVRALREARQAEEREAQEIAAREESFARLSIGRPIFDLNSTPRDDGDSAACGLVDPSIQRILAQLSGPDEPKLATYHVIGYLQSRLEACRQRMDPREYDKQRADLAHLDVLFERLVRERTGFFFQHWLLFERSKMHSGHPLYQREVPRLPHAGEPSQQAGPSAVIESERTPEEHVLNYNKGLASNGKRTRAFTPPDEGVSDISWGAKRPRSARVHWDRR